MGQGMFDGFGGYLIVTGLLSVLGLWKAVEIVLWVSKHIHWS